ncbi:uncharacterized protein [Prorops nasuta]|uniref:uncharacterized protein n=1 Tax=Prorops nasuta TaxID=863751 RepID=UPI0034CF7D42
MQEVSTIRRTRYECCVDLKDTKSFVASPPNCRDLLHFLFFEIVMENLTSVELTDILITYGMANENASAAELSKTACVVPHTNLVYPNLQLEKSCIGTACGRTIFTASSSYCRAILKVGCTSAKVTSTIIFGFIAQCRRDPDFPDRILWTDESTFTPNGIFNSRNYIVWREENPHAARECAFQYRYTVNVWAGLIGNNIIGPYFLPPRLNGEVYADFLREQLGVLLEDVPLHVWNNLIFQHDGAPPHYRLNVRSTLNDMFPERWMGRGGPITWPARSPDLNPLDFFLWGHVKALVEDWRNGTEEQVRDAIVAAFRSITPDMVHRATRNIVRRSELCSEQNGRHFEQLLH